MEAQHKLYNWEITPPAQAWDRISEELDAALPYQNLASRLHNTAVAPPDNMWLQIGHALNDEDLYTQLAAKLQHLEIMPPAGNWYKIEENISASQPLAKVVTMPQRGIKWQRYAVAASIAGLLGVFGYKMTQRATQTSAAIAYNLNSESEAAATAPVPITKTATIVANKNNKKADTASLSATDTPLPAVKATDNGYATPLEKNKEINGRYIVLMTENGDVVRMSKKLGAVADCIAGDEGDNCSDQIAGWQKELATTPMPASPDNFLDVLNLANQEEGM